MSDLPGFRWLGGMMAVPLDANGQPMLTLRRRVVGVSSVDGSPLFYEHVYGEWVPDFTDPLTALGLLVLVREAHPDATVYTLPPSPLSLDPKWTVRRQTQTDPNSVLDETIGEGRTETKALKAALAAAPRKP